LPPAEALYYSTQMIRHWALTRALLGVLWISRLGYAGVTEGGPQKLSDVSSIGESLRNAGQRAIHILYVHGIGATGAGDSKRFQRSVCAFLKDCSPPAGPDSRDYADTGLFTNGAQPPNARYLGQQIWRSAEEFSAAAPFVDHYLLKRSKGGPIVVDEINWWPLVFALKCRAMLPGEARLAGPNAGLLGVCSQKTEPDSASPGRFRSYAWISSAEAKKLTAMPSRAALVNHDLKDALLDWGFSDALMAVGSMHDFFREGMRQLFVKAARFKADGSKTDEWQAEALDPKTTDREFIVVSHSLGSYLVFSTLNVDGANVADAAPDSSIDQGREDLAARYILGRTSLVYFFANQVPLLELANVERARGGGAALGGALQQAPSMANRINAWKQLRQDVIQKSAPGPATPRQPPQVIAWSDPSDLLSWHVPSIDGIIIVNLYVRNAWWHWLFESPGAAHDNYAVNHDVIHVMLGPPATRDGER